MSRCAHDVSGCSAGPASSPLCQCLPGRHTTVDPSACWLASLAGARSLRFGLVAWAVLAAWATGAAVAQSTVIRGRVFEAASNEPVPFASIRVVNAERGTIAGEDGTFVINGVQPGFYRLAASVVGYRTA